MTIEGHYLIVLTEFEHREETYSSAALAAIDS